jgi:hypothetical protein
MAEIIRQEYRLPALRFSFQFVNRKPFVQIRAHHGRDELAVESVPAAEIGISERLSVPAYRGVQFRLPQQVVQKLANALSGRGDDDTVWLQIDRSAGFLAVVPWERLLAPVISGPMLRIPNFLVDPAFIVGRLDLVICGSAPEAKEFYPVADFIINLIERIQQAVTQGTDIHVFSDGDAFRYLETRFPSATTSLPHRVRVYHPERSAQFGRGSSDISESEKLQSPWLRWMKAELGARSVDAVHFICPGYFNAKHGCLALARSPLDNIDNPWSHFVGGSELCTFLNELGAGAIAFGSPYEDIWALGLRLLADELAWTRPGAVMLYEAQDRIEAVTQAYRFLFGESYGLPPQRGELMLYCHPRRLERYADVPYFVSPTMSSGDLAYEWMSAPMEQAASKAPRLQERGPLAAPAEPRWARANRKIIEQLLVENSDQSGVLAQGASEAIRFLTKLQSKYLKEQE